jgi:SAM-dependent methyltransferase
MKDSRPAAMRVGSPSRLLVRIAQEFPKDMPVLDAGCGTGRNAVALSELGLHVVCADRDRDRLDKLIEFVRPADRVGRLQPICAHLAATTWPFGPNCFSAVVCVHYLDVALLPSIHFSLAPGGRLYIETIGGQGMNYLELPLAGELFEMLSPRFQLQFYEERPVGPPTSNRCAVKLLAQKLR